MIVRYVRSCALTLQAENACCDNDGHGDLGGDDRVLGAGGLGLSALARGVAMSME